MVRVVVASDKFKGSLTSAEVAAAVAAGVGRVHSAATVASVPVADGGDGTLAAAVAAGYQLVPVVASGPTGRPVSTGYARLGDIAVVELADVCGLVRLPGGVPEPMAATSYGMGQVMAAALDAGCTRVILAIGGSASTDGGTGLVQALAGGAYGIEPSEQSLVQVGEQLAGVRVIVACDVDNPLTGPRGAAAVYGPQKGATAEQVAELDRRLTAWAEQVAEQTGQDLRDTPGAGAAGGVGFAALALLKAELRPGIDLVLDMVRFREQLSGADLVITGEGALDEQTLHGKAVAGVAAAARASGVPLVAVCGINRLLPEQLTAAGVRAAYSLNELQPDLQRCIAEPIPLLQAVGERIAKEHLR
ncbi:glycerate kinase [Kribbella sp. NPDC026611]|uniref:glycerate kinase n=1 Tax=Kribbella sp. NPDC026611 TaxID=3154911 RepID=UPI0033C666F4